MHLHLLRTHEGIDDSQLKTLIDFGTGIKAYANIDDADYTLSITKERTVYIFGDLFYLRQGKGIKSISSQLLKNILAQKELAAIVQELEGQYIGLDVNLRAKTIKIFSDRYARVDSFYTHNTKQFCLATNLDFISRYNKLEVDQRMLAHMCTVYGWYTPKGMTMYKGVYQHKVDEILTLKANQILSSQLQFKPQTIRELGKEGLEDYYRYLTESIQARVPKNTQTIWVSSSSGWDSSIILGLLVNLYGSKRVRMMTGSMQYSDNTGLINHFELNKIKKIGAFYGIKPSTVDLDFKRSKAIFFWQKIAAPLKAKQMYTMTGFNFGRIAQGIAQMQGEPAVVFNGETSDSFHNFGFSQFVTFFHTVKSFTEYGDKMNCYLYSPSFLSKVLNGTYQKDKVFQVFAKMTGVSFEDKWSNRQNMLESYLLPLFYGGPRLPFAKTLNNPMLKAQSIASVRAIPFRDFAPQVLKTLDETNLYAWIIHLYLSMHSQGSTVGIHKHAMELFGHSWRSPFNDYRLIELLSQAPESWGRGLDFNHTKYPLKWVAQNKIKFPYDLLQGGPHSYLYDVIEGFSLISEIMYRSAFTGYFKEILRTRTYRELFSPQYFDTSYIERLAQDYLNGKEAKGQDFTNLFTLITFTSTGWY